MKHPHSAASASSAASPPPARAACIERARAAGLERTREAGLERSRAAAREGARRLSGILEKKAQSARHQRRVAQATRMNCAATMASNEATNNTRRKVFHFSTAAHGPVSADKATESGNRTATDGGVTDADVDRQEAQVEVEFHFEDAAS